MTSLPNTEKIAVITRISKRIAGAVLHSVQIDPVFLEDIEQDIFYRLSPLWEEYRPGDLSRFSFLYRRAQKIGSKIIRFYSADKRAELLHRDSPPIGEDGNEQAPLGSVSWVEALVSTPSKAELCACVHERQKLITEEERQLLHELMLGIQPKESELNWPEAKRRKIHEGLKRKFADLQIFLTEC